MLMTQKAVCYAEQGSRQALNKCELAHQKEQQNDRKRVIGGRQLGEHLGLIQRRLRLFYMETPNKNAVIWRGFEYRRPAKIPVLLK